MSPLRPAVLLPLVLLWLAGCDATPSAATGALQLSVSTLSATPGDITRVTVTVSAPDMSPMTVPLALTAGTWSGVIEGIPVGSGRVFLAQAFDAANALRYEGRVENVSVTAGSLGLVSLLLRELDAPAFDNASPVVDTLTASVLGVAPGGTVSLSATAHDPNAGDTVSYAWSAPSGTFSAPTQASTTWTASTFQAPVRLTLTVSDTKGAASTASVPVNVSAGGGTSEVKVDFNAAPRLSRLRSSQSFLDVGQTTSLSVSATDADGDGLSYQWSATCAGTFTGPPSSSVTFTPSARPGTACNNCQVRVLVTDARGGQNTGALALCVASGASAHAAPRFTFSRQSSATARGHAQLHYEVGAQDPEGGALTFAWTAHTGTLGTATSYGTGSRVVWTSPGCDVASPVPDITVTVTNAWGRSALERFNPPLCAPAGSWTPVLGAGQRRQGHEALRLATGRVLVAGGYDGATKTYLTAVDLYDPLTESFTATGPLSSARTRAAATPLPNGKVLLSGGVTSGGTLLATAELYDPATGTWSPTGALSAPRAQHTSLLLATGKVLVLGGLGLYGSQLATAELYDPATGKWSATGPLSTPRSQHAALLLATGKVLVMGGHSGQNLPLATAELYDPATGKWSATGALGTARRDHAALLLTSGQVLVAGGNAYANQASAKAELYDPATGSWSAAAPLSTPRHSHTLTLLRGGKVLASGGFNEAQPGQGTTELYDPLTGTWSPLAPMTSVRALGKTLALASGQVLVLGGDNASGDTLSTSEVYTPVTGP